MSYIIITSINYLKLITTYLDNCFVKYLIRQPMKHAQIKHQTIVMGRQVFTIAYVSKTDCRLIKKGIYTFLQWLCMEFTDCNAVILECNATKAVSMYSGH